TSVKFGTAVAAVVSSSDSQIVVTVPSAAITGKITVTTASGIGISTGIFTVIKAPTISTVGPSSGTFGATITISGTNLGSATDVKFNGTSITDPITVVTVNMIKVIVPAGATSGTVSVTNPAGTATSAASLTVIQP